MTPLTKKNYSRLQCTKVKYSLLQFATMVLWNFDLLWKNWFCGKNCGTLEKIYGAMDKTMFLQTKLWYQTENYGTSIYQWKKEENDENFIYNAKNMV